MRRKPGRWECGNLGGLPDFQGTVEREGNPVLVFLAFHGPAISTAPGWPALQRSRHRKRGGGRGDSILHDRSSLTLAALIFLANSVSLMAAAVRPSDSMRMPSLR
jgi:hypothetical protein